MAPVEQHQMQESSSGIHARRVSFGEVKDQLAASALHRIDFFSPLVTNTVSIVAHQTVVMDSLVS
ncbi:MAG TPA: hypothetical protein VGJ06_01520 [Candidatus Acidoferrum sp.]|jgi:hypothetical protein